MPLSYSIQDHSALFGVGFSTSTHLERLEAAQTFYQVRRDIEKAKTRLASLTAVAFRKRKREFRAKIVKVLCGNHDSQVLATLPALGQHNGSPQRVWHFIVACMTFSEELCKKIQQAGLVEDLPDLFRGIVGHIAVPAETSTAIIETLREICNEHKIQSTNMLLDRLDATENAPAMTASESRNQPPLKRARTEPDGFDATSLWKEIMEIDEEHLERGDAPLVVPLRQIVIQFSEANAHRLETLLGNSPLALACKKSRQWRWERLNDEVAVDPDKQQTSCMIALDTIPAGK
ncbi:uncharacterized protein HMPREF1541_09032 [Cyphellophora europaea CBS 101466]|uniref:Uncharacterized protein n=1 Tax=Cyphellophora europaea (strain CBS 101466) TaxID=1220924 RepID=W2RLZ3_CYPE1|nr:uncharacterized protein HMPREF1541_09032 [Cyphellophora europaea CBS 101466]ETN36754.1 hypothetical protein HMPREF1541_09032 [Cyphellophora europaea CBS 101466]